MIKPTRKHTDLCFHELETSKDAAAFRLLNEEWISHHFVLEARDHEQLSNPQAILDRGGHIYLADAEQQTVGCVALVPMGNGIYELSKMAVSPDQRGRGIGRLILQHVIEEARRLGADALFLGSNTVLASAVKLYESAGFQHLPQHRVPNLGYSRANVFMELNLQNSQSEPSRHGEKTH